MRQRGGWLPGTLWFLGLWLVAMALVSTAILGFGEGVLDGVGVGSVKWPVSIAALVLGSSLIWLSRR